MTKTTRNSIEQLAGSIRSRLAAPHDGNAWDVFKQHLVDADLDDEQVVQASQRADNIWTLLHGAWKRRTFASTCRRIAKEPRVMDAVRAAVAHGDIPSTPMLAALLVDGQPESVDALVRHVESIVSERDMRLDMLLGMRELAAPTPALRALFAELEATRDARNAASPVLALAAQLGLGLELLWFTVRLEAPPFYGDVHVDSRASSIASLIHHQGYRRRDIEPCDDVARLPSWIATTAATLGVTWAITLKKCNLRGRQRARIIEWLRGSS